MVKKGFKRTEENKKNIRNGLKTYYITHSMPSTKGCKISDEHKKKISDYWKNHPEENKIRTNKIRIKTKNYAIEHGSPSKGCTRSEDTRKQISNSVKKSFDADDKKLRIQCSIRMKNEFAMRTDYIKRILKSCCHSKIEIKIRNFLKNINVNFDVNVCNLIGSPDIVITPNICIFADGDYYHANPKKYNENDYIEKCRKTAKQIWEYDAKVTSELQKQGYEVIRFWEHDINKNFDIVTAKIQEVCT